jgi:4-amino-4-deoxy-L-arabinose transferase-like glycosyltransferase
MTRAARLLLIPVFLSQVVYFLFITRHRFVNGDEGFYLLASRLVLMHKKPYLDFSYVQAPLLPYIYAGWLKIVGLSWASARLLSVLTTGLLGTLVYSEVCFQTRQRLAGVAAGVLFSFNTLVFNCFPIVHTFSLAALLLFAAYVVVGRLPERSSSWTLGLAGALLGLAIDTRSYLVLVTPIFLWWISRHSVPPKRISATFSFVGGSLAGIAPCVCLFILSPSAFWFNNVGYHTMRSDAGMARALLEKLTVLLMFFLGGPQGNGMQNSILFFVSVAFIFSTYRLRDSPRLAFNIALAVGLVSLLPTPIYPGYFSLCIPFLLVTAVCIGSDLFCYLVSGGRRLLCISGWVVLMAIYLGAAIPDLRKYLLTGEGIASVGRAHDKGDWRLGRIVEVSQAIDEIANPGEAVASFWPGYIFQTHAVPWQGLENDFVLPIADKMTAEQRERYHVLSLREIQKSLSGHTPRIVVLGNQNRLAADAVGDEISSALDSCGYKIVRTIGDTSIYVCCTNP